MPDWQMIATLVCLVLAGHFVVRRVLRLGGKPNSSSCGSCASNRSSQAEAKPLVPLDTPDQRR